MKVWELLAASGIRGQAIGTGTKPDPVQAIESLLRRSEADAAHIAKTLPRETGVRIAVVETRGAFSLILTQAGLQTLHDVAPGFLLTLDAAATATACARRAHERCPTAKQAGHGHHQ
jgi:hypothetical protein